MPLFFKSFRKDLIPDQISLLASEFIIKTQSFINNEIRLHVWHSVSASPHKMFIRSLKGSQDLFILLDPSSDKPSNDLQLWLDFVNDNLRTVLNSLKVIEVIINISNIIKEEDETKYSFMVEKISQIFFKNANIPVVLNFLRIDWEDYQFVDSSMNKLVLSLIKQ